MYAGSINKKKSFKSIDTFFFFVKMSISNYSKYLLPLRTYVPEVVYIRQIVYASNKRIAVGSSIANLLWKSVTVSVSAITS